MDDNERYPIEPELLFIPAGSFIVGTGDERVDLLARRSSAARAWRKKSFFAREQPEHTVQLAAFQVARLPVSVAEYRLFLTDSGYHGRGYWTDVGWRWLRQSSRSQPNYWDDPKWTAEERLPVVGVTWHEAQAYCRWLAKKTGRPYRLPSEAQWEAAARGPDGRLYPWGETFDASRCNCRDSGVGQTVVPGRYSPAGDSPCGSVDMIGNVSEWTMSLFLPYPIKDQDGRDDPEAAGARVIRGGSWFSPAIRARATARGNNDPDFSDHDLGFRLAAGAY